MPTLSTPTAPDIPTWPDFYAHVQPRNPDYTAKELADIYVERYGHPDPSTLVPFDQFLATVKPRNPDYTDAELKTVWRDRYGVFGAPEQAPSFWESVKQGAKGGAYAVGAAGVGTLERVSDIKSEAHKFLAETETGLLEEARKYAPDPRVAEQPWYQRLTDPAYLGNVLGNVAVQTTPTVAGALTGRVIGGIVGGPAGAIAGTAAGIMVVTYLQQAGSTYREALDRYTQEGMSEPDAHRKAYTVSGIGGLVSGVVNTLAVPASLVTPFTRRLTNLALQYSLNIGVDTADQLTQNIVARETYAPETTLTAGVPEAVVGSALISAPETMVVVKAGRAAARRAEPAHEEQLAQEKAKLQDMRAKTRITPGSTLETTQAQVMATQTTDEAVAAARQAVEGTPLTAAAFTAATELEAAPELPGLVPAPTIAAPVGVAPQPTEIVQPEPIGAVRAPVSLFPEPAEGPEPTAPPEPSRPTEERRPLAPVRFEGIQRGSDDLPAFALWTALADIPPTATYPAGISRGSTISSETLERAGLEVPPLPEAAQRDVAHAEQIAQERMRLQEQRTLATESSTAQTIITQIHQLAEAKAIPWDDNPRFLAWTKQLMGQPHLDDLSVADLQRFLRILGNLPADSPFAAQLRGTGPVSAPPPSQPALAPTAARITPTGPTLEPVALGTVPSDPATTPRSELPPEQNAEILARAMKAQADLDSAGTERGGKVFLEQQGHGSTPDIRALKSATAPWYKEATTGPSSLSKQRVERAVQKILEDKGRDTGKDVQRVKELLLMDPEFRQSGFMPPTEAAWQEMIQFALGQAASPAAEAVQQTMPSVPPPTVGERPIIGREAIPAEAPLFSRAAQTPESEQTRLPESPATVIASALRQAADTIERGGPPVVREVEPLGAKESLPRTQFARSDLSEPDPRVFTQYLRNRLVHAPIIGETALPLIDTSDQYPLELMDRVAGQPHTQRLTEEIAHAFETMRVGLPVELQDVRLLGLSPDNDFEGLHVFGMTLRRGEQPTNVVILNPYKILDHVSIEIRAGTAPPEIEPHIVAHEVSETLIHELTHQLVPHSQSDPADAVFQSHLQTTRNRLRSISDQATERLIALFQEDSHGRPILARLTEDLDEFKRYYVATTRQTQGPAQRRPATPIESLPPEAGPDRGPGGRVRPGDAVRSGPPGQPGQQVPAAALRGRGPTGVTAGGQTSLLPPRQPPTRQQRLYPPGPPLYSVHPITQMDNIWRAFAIEYIDMTRLVGTVKAMLTSSGQELADALNPVLKEEMYQSRVMHETTTFVKQELNPLIERMRLNRTALPEMDRFVHARHVLLDEVNARLQAMNPDHPHNEALSGMTDAEAQQIVDSAPPIMETLAQRVDQIVAKNRQLLVQYGLQSQETVDRWAETYPHYVPLQRAGFEEEAGGHAARAGSKVKPRLGSEREVVHIMANLIRQREQIIVEGEKMKVKVALAGLLMQYPNRDMATLVKPAPITYTDPVTGLDVTVPGNIGEYRVPLIKRLNPETGTVEFIPDPQYKGRDNVVNFRVDGHDFAIVFNEENPRAMKIANWLKSSDLGQMHAVLEMAAPLTRYYGAVNTQYSPTFGPFNLARDLFFAQLKLSATPLAGKQGQVLKSILAFLPSLYLDIRADRAGKPRTTESATWYARFQKAGGPTGYRDLFRTSAARASAVEHALDPEWWQKTWAGKVVTAGGVLAPPLSVLHHFVSKPMIEWLSDLNLTMENATRLAVFKTAIEHGISEEQSASLAKNVTVNFNRKGTISRQMGALYAFFNASAQGTYAVAETLFEKNPDGSLSGTISSVGKKIIAGGVILGAIQAALLAAAGFDEEDLPEWQKARNFIVPVPGTEKGYVSYPYPLGFNVLPNLGRLGMEVWLYGKPVDKAWKFAVAAIDVFSPWGAAPSISQMITPTALDPLIALGENQDWAGRPIERRDVSTLHPTPGPARARDVASPWARGLATAINWVTLGTAGRPGKLSPTPDAIDYLVGQVTGGIGRTVSQTAQILSGVATGEDVPFYKVPLLGRFVGSATGTSAIRERFYGNVRELNIVQNEMDAIREEVRTRRTDPSALRAYVQAHPAARLVELGNQMEREVSQLQTRKREMRTRGESRERVQLLEQQIHARMQRFNERVRLYGQPAAAATAR